MPTPYRPTWRSKQAAPRKASGPLKPITDDVTWTRQVEPRERYRVVYIDRHDERSERVIELLRIGHLDGTPYLGVMDQGKFKTLRTERVVEVLEQLTTGHAPSIHPQPTYSTALPHFPLTNAVYKEHTIAAGNRTWTVDLNRYTCTCPEKRIRSGMGYEPGRLGFVCPHMARAIVAHLPAGAEGWPPELLAFLNDPRRTHISNLS